MISINGILNENLDLLIEGELFNGSANYITYIIIDTGFVTQDDATHIALSDKISAKLKLQKSEKTFEIWHPTQNKPVICQTANLGIRLKENNQTKFEVEKINAVILPNLHDDEILIGPDFLLKDLKCRRLIINYEEFYFKVVI